VIICLWIAIPQQAVGYRFVKNGVINLGSLPLDRSIAWEDGEDFIMRLLIYGCLRDKLRNIYNPLNKKNR